MWSYWIDLIAIFVIVKHHLFKALTPHTFTFALLLGAGEATHAMVRTL